MVATVHAEAVKTALATVTVNSIPIPVGDGRREHPAPCYVLYDLDGGSTSGSEADDDDVDWPFQVTCVGRVAQEARFLADSARAALTGLSVPGRTLISPFTTDTFGGVRRDDDTGDDPLFYATPRFRLRTSPT